MMDLDVVGRHALLFDDDATAAFLNSGDALVEWNSLLIDRYDVRHLLSAPPPSGKRRQPASASVSSIESEFDDDRYHDLPPPSDEQEHDQGSKPAEAGYHAVAFSYGNTEDSIDQDNASARFRPPFPVPESLLQSLPATEKVHQIIARTAMFVRKHGGQSEIILRVKQGDNPTFGFLMPNHHLHAYFRFLVDHQELLQFGMDRQPQNEDKKSSTEQNQTHDIGGGALSLLGSLYSGEDEDDTAEHTREPEQNVSGETSVPVSATLPHLEQNESSVKAAVKDEGVSKHLLLYKEKTSALRRKSLINPPKVGSTSTRKKEDHSIGSVFEAVDKSPDSAPAMSEKELSILEPPSDMKRSIDKIIEFIMKNGKQFEAALIEQDSKHGRFPFLLPSNQYHPYYVKVLKKAQESKLTSKSFLSERDGLLGPGLDKKNYLSKQKDTLSLGTSGGDIPFDSDRKEKFKMIIGKSKKDGQDPSSKATQQEFGVTVDAAAAAAILQAASRGIKNPNLGILSSTSLNGNSVGPSSEVGQASSLSSHPSSQPENATHKSDQNGGKVVSVPVAKAIAKTAAVEAASEADSSEAHLTKEQKLKAERLKRAKMFVAMLKSGAAPVKAEPRALSAEPQVSGVSGSGAEFKPEAKEREGSCVPFNDDTLNKIDTSGKKIFCDDCNERQSRRKYRSRSSRHEDEDDDEEERVHKHSRKKYRSQSSPDEDQIDEERVNKHTKKRHLSRHSSHVEDEGKDKYEGDYRKHSRKYWSHHSPREEDKEEEEKEEEKDEDGRDYRHSRKRHHSSRSSQDEDVEDHDERGHKRSSSKHRSHSSSHHRRDRHKHRKRHSSSKHKESRHSYKHDSSSDSEHRHHSRSDKHKKESQSEREELEEGEISTKVSDQSGGSVGVGASREASVDVMSSYQERRAPSQPSETTEVSDDLRAKIRAMLMATL